jgi:transmembrane sensor
MDELLAKYMMGEATPAEMELVAQWRKEGEYNEKYFAHFQLIWKTAKNLQKESHLDVEDSWAEFRQLRVKAIPNPAVKFIHTEVKDNFINSYAQWLKMAAVWVSIISLVALWYTFTHTAEPGMLQLQSFNTVKTDTLPDGSVITLNKNSVLSYPEQFKGNTREIALLKGEAFFKIAHNHTKPFIVHLNDAVVKVVGTSFNIRHSKVDAEVIVETGIVEVISKKVTIRLQPKEKAEIDYQSGTITKGLSKDNFFNYYRTNEFVANQTPLWRIVEVLNAVYQVNILVPDPVLANRTLTTTLRLGALDPILDVIANTFNVRIVREPGKIIIKQ